MPTLRWSKLPFMIVRFWPFSASRDGQLPAISGHHGMWPRTSFLSAIDHIPFSNPTTRTENIKKGTSPYKSDSTSPANNLNSMLRTHFNQETNGNIECARTIHFAAASHFGLMPALARTVCQTTMNTPKGFPKPQTY